MNAHQVGIHDPAVDALVDSPSGAAIREYLDLMEDTEAPRAFLTWSLIAASAALLGRNAAFYSGPNHSVMPNLFVILLGPSGIRKSTAIKYIEKLIQGTSINFGPTDTSGQRQGIMSALTGLRRSDYHERPRTIDSGPLVESMIYQRQSSDMMLLAPELGRLLGSASREMADFLVDLYDGAKIDYQTKAGETKLWKPLVTLLGATTPSSLALVLPENAVGHGILARMVFVYEESLHKNVPLPPEQTEEWQERQAKFKRRLRWVDGNRLNFTFSDSARSTFTDLYTYVPELEDPRLASYKQRRPDTLIKVSMALAALRADTTISESDVLLSHSLLTAAEPKMHRALEHFGRNRVYQGRMLMLEYFKAGHTAATHAELKAAASSELNNREASEAIESMLASGELIAYGDNLLPGSSLNELEKAKAKKKAAQK